MGYYKNDSTSLRPIALTLGVIALVGFIAMFMYAGPGGKNLDKAPASEAQQSTPAPISSVPATQSAPAPAKQITHTHV